MEKNFDKDINTILKEIDFEDVKESIYDWFFSWKQDKFIYNEEGMFYVLYDLMNYDYICPTEEGNIDEDNSNRPLIARVIKQYADTETVKKVYDRLYRK